MPKTCFMVFSIKESFIFLNNTVCIGGYRDMRVLGAEGRVGRRLCRGIYSSKNGRVGLRGCGGVHGEYEGLKEPRRSCGSVALLIFRTKRDKSATCTTY